MTRKPTICATFLEKLAIKALLDERLHAVEGTDMFRYEEGWNDEVVAKTVREELSDNIAAKIRTECFGKLHNHGRKLAAPSGGLKLRITVLEDRFQRALSCMKLTPEEWEFILAGPSVDPQLMEETS